MRSQPETWENRARKVKDNSRTAKPIKAVLSHLRGGGKLAVHHPIVILTIVEGLEEEVIPHPTLQGIIDKQVASVDAVSGLILLHPQPEYVVTSPTTITQALPIVLHAVLTFLFLQHFQVRPRTGAAGTLLPYGNVLAQLADVTVQETSHRHSQGQFPIESTRQGGIENQLRLLTIQARNPSILQVRVHVSIGKGNPRRDLP